jgi:hypothetical protein
MNTRSIAVIRREQQEVATLTKQFKERLSEYTALQQFTDKAAKDEIEAFVLVGQVLIEVKAKLPHGKWQGWLGQHFGKSYDTATRWMRVARWAGENVAHVQHLPSVAALMRACGEERRPQVSEPQAFSLAVALRYVAPLKRLTVESVRALPLDEQYALKAALKPGHDVYEALPEPPPTPG